MEINEVLLEILSEVKKLTSEQSTTNAKLEACIKMTDRQDIEIRTLQANNTEVHRHGVIIKGMLWMYGIIISGLIVKFFSSKLFS